MTATATDDLHADTLGVNVFTAPGKSVVGERPRLFGEPLGWDPITSTLIYGEYDAVLVDTLATVAEAEALADWVALHHRNLTTIYSTHGHFDHFFGLSVLLDRQGVAATELVEPDPATAQHARRRPPHVIRHHRGARRCRNHQHAGVEEGTQTPHSWSAARLTPNQHEHQPQGERPCMSSRSETPN
jgi:glyoxylase-like metal-dependent hydrolase (beta-lactamase superfamily II)